MRNNCWLKCYYLLAITLNQRPWAQTHALQLCRSSKKSYQLQGQGTITFNKGNFQAGGCDLKLVHSQESSHVFLSGVRLHNVSKLCAHPRVRIEGVIFCVNAKANGVIIPLTDESLDFEIIIAPVQTFGFEYYSRVFTCNETYTASGEDGFPAVFASHLNLQPDDPAPRACQLEIRGLPNNGKEILVQRLHGTAKNVLVGNVTFDRVLNRNAFVSPIQLQRTAKISVGGLSNGSFVVSFQVPFCSDDSPLVLNAVRTLPRKPWYTGTKVTYKCDRGWKFLTKVTENVCNTKFKGENYTTSWTDEVICASELHKEEPKPPIIDLIIALPVGAAGVLLLGGGIAAVIFCMKKKRKKKKARK